MGLSCVGSRALWGIESPSVHIEVHVSNGLPALSIVGLPEASVKESKDRVRSALLNSGFQLPPKRITVNLAPAELPKTGGRYDLPIALAILEATEQLPQGLLSEFEVYGELALNGDIRAVRGVISSLTASLSVGKSAIISAENSVEAILFNQSKSEVAEQVYLVKSLKQACQVLLASTSDNREDIQSYSLAASNELNVDNSSVSHANYHVDFSEVIGQAQAKRALEVAASGSHSLMMVGPPGAGKSMLASRLITILPQLTGEEALEVAKIKSLSLSSEPVSKNITQFYQRPYESPHHTASAAAIVGGGTNPKPGALSLAHNGVLFLDELPEFNRAVLEALREPLETKQVNISRVNQHVSYPANNLLVAAMNPSPSGYFPDDYLGRCKDTPDQILRYQKKISGPLIDRIDLHLEVPAIEVNELRNQQHNSEESSSVIRSRVEQARLRQMARQSCLNADLNNEQIKQFCMLDPLAEKILDKAVEGLGLSVRAYHRVLKVARTIADMHSAELIESAHIAEALSYRAMSKAFN